MPRIKKSSRLIKIIVGNPVYGRSAQMGSGKYSSSQYIAYQKKPPIENFETVRTRYRTLKTTERKWVILKFKVRHNRVRVKLWPLRGPLKTPPQSTSHAVQQGLTELAARFLWFVDHPRSRRNSTPVSSSYSDIGRKHYHSTHTMPLFGPGESNPAKKARRANEAARDKCLKQMKKVSSSSRKRKSTTTPP